MISPPVLRSLNYKKPFIITSDASDHTIGASLEQEYDGNRHLVDVVGRRLTTSEENYATSEKELLGVIFAIQKWRPFLLTSSEPTIIQVDHLPLLYLKNLRDFNGRLGRCLITLNEVPHDLKYIRGKTNKMADALSFGGATLKKC